MTAEEMLARLLYRDGLMLVVDKPAGYAVHRGPKGGEALEDYFGALRFGLPRAPALAHRLDRDTSGCLVLGRHRKALALLGKLFKNGKVAKTYWAVVEGGPQDDEGRIDIALAKRDESRGWWMKADPHGLPSATTWKVMGRATVPHSLFTSPWRGEVGARSAPGEGESDGEEDHPTPDRVPRSDPPLQGRVKERSPGSRLSRSPAAPINCACIAPRWAFRLSAIPSMATRRATAARRYTCTRAR